MRNPTAFLKTEYDVMVKDALDWRPKELQGMSKPRARMAGKDVLLLCANNYLGLSTHPKLINAAIEATKKYGAGAGAVPGIAGTMTLHTKLYEALARFKKTEAAMTYPTGFAVNAGLIPQLVGEGDLTISDQLNHGSIIDGVRLSKTERAVYKHCDMADLARVLEEAEKREKPPRRILIITDGVFSMDGDIAPLDKIAALGAKHGAMVYVDDAHGDGVLGEGGRGAMSHFHLTHKDVHVEMGTFSKGFGVVGGHVVGSRDLINFAYNKSRTWLLSSAQSPAVLAACIAAIEVLETEPQHVQNVWKNTAYFKKAVNDLGFNTGNSQTPIIPIICGESHKARALSETLWSRGIYVLPIVFPMVSKDSARIRCQMHAQMTQQDLDFAISEIEAAGKTLGIIK